MKSDKNKINRLLKTAKGQIDGILNMVEEDQYCIDIFNQVLAAEAVLRRVNKEILRAHLNSCVLDSFSSGSQQETEKKIEEIISVMEKLTK